MSGPASVSPRTTPRLARVCPAKPCPLKRFGLETGKQVRRDLLRRVRSGDVLYARKLTHARTVIVLRYAGEELAFIYSSAHKSILCFLPPGAPETEDWRQSPASAWALFSHAPGHPPGHAE